MTTHDTTQWIGVDVAKPQLDIATSASDQPLRLPNTRRDIRRWLSTLSGSIHLAVEATNSYHCELVEQAHARGLTVYLIDGYRLSKYREGIGGRAKTDTSDARLLLRYVQHEHADLRPWSPPPKGYDALHRLLHRRAKLVKARTALRQSLAGLPEMKVSVHAMLRTMTHLDALICRRIRRLTAQLGWDEDIRRSQGVEGIGPITGCALTMVYRRGQFKSADAYIAFMGMDVRVRESGSFKGHRRLTKKGDPEMRRLLYMAAMHARTTATWEPFYARLLARGLTRIQALVALARKLARIVFALLKKGATYVPKSHAGGCAAA